MPIVASPKRLLVFPDINSDPTLFGHFSRYFPNTLPFRHHSSVLIFFLFGLIFFLYSPFSYSLFCHTVFFLCVRGWTHLGGGQMWLCRADPNHRSVACHSHTFSSSHHVRPSHSHPRPDPSSRWSQTPSTRPLKTGYLHVNYQVHRRNRPTTRCMGETCMVECQRKQGKWGFPHPHRLSCHIESPLCYRYTRPLLIRLPPVDTPTPCWYAHPLSIWYTRPHWYAHPRWYTHPRWDTLPPVDTLLSIDPASCRYARPLLICLPMSIRLPLVDTSAHVNMPAHVNTPTPLLIHLPPIVSWYTWPHVDLLTLRLIGLICPP